MSFKYNMLYFCERSGDPILYINFKVLPVLLFNIFCTTKFKMFFVSIHLNLKSINILSKYGNG